MNDASCSGPSRVGVVLPVGFALGLLVFAVLHGLWRKYLFDGAHEWAHDFGLYRTWYVWLRVAAWATTPVLSGLVTGGAVALLLSGPRPARRVLLALVVSVLQLMTFILYWLRFDLDRWDVLAGSQEFLLMPLCLPVGAALGALAVGGRRRARAAR